MKVVAGGFTEELRPSDLVTRSSNFSPRFISCSMLSICGSTAEHKHRRAVA